MNARKVVEPICLDVLLKWRGDEETGRDQMDEILREVVIITDSEGEHDEGLDETTDHEDDSDEEGELTSSSSEDESEQPGAHSHLQHVNALVTTNSRQQGVDPTSASYHTQSMLREPVILSGPGNLDRGFSQGRTQPGVVGVQPTRRSNRIVKKQEKLAQKGFQRYRNALADAIQRRDNGFIVTGQTHERSTPGIPGGRIISSEQMLPSDVHQGPDYTIPRRMHQGTSNNAVHIVGVSSTSLVR